MTLEDPNHYQLYMMIAYTLFIIVVNDLIRLYQKTDFHKRIHNYIVDHIWNFFFKDSEEEI